MAGPEPEPGDLIEIARLLHSDWAIYVGDGYVVHLTDPNELAGVGACSNIMSGLQGEALVKKSLLSEVVCKNWYKINNMHDDKLTAQPLCRIMQLVEELLGTKVPYNMRNKNSQHFVSHLRYGLACSGQPQPNPGDLIEIFHSLCNHWAIYIGDGYVVHLTHPMGLDIMSTLWCEALVKKELLYVAVGCDEYQINNKNYDKYPMLPLNKIIKRAEELVGKTVPYNMITKNNQHFVNELRYGNTCDDKPDLKVGDLIEIFRKSYRHWAIYVGDGYVVHLTPPSKIAGADSTNAVPHIAIVKKELLYVVAGKDKYQINNKHDHKYQVLPQKKIIRKAKAMVKKEVPYKLSSKNSELFVNRLRYGKLPQSQEQSQDLEEERK